MFNVYLLTLSPSGKSCEIQSASDRARSSLANLLYSRLAKCKVQRAKSQWDAGFSNAPGHAYVAAPGVRMDRQFFDRRRHNFSTNPTLIGIQQTAVNCIECGFHLAVRFARCLCSTCNGQEICATCVNSLSTANSSVFLPDEYAESISPLSRK